MPGIGSYLITKLKESSKVMCLIASIFVLILLRKAASTSLKKVSSRHSLHFDPDGPGCFHHRMARVDERSEVSNEEAGNRDILRLHEVCRFVRKAR